MLSLKQLRAVCNCMKISNLKKRRLSKTWKRRQAITTTAMVDMVMAMVTTAMVIVMGMDMVITMEDTITMAMVAMVATMADMDTTAVMDTEATIENMFLLQKCDCRLSLLSFQYCIYFLRL